jgi:ATP-dependent exoDNAse (exonuclease V) alpha subunit
MNNPVIPRDTVLIIDESSLLSAKIGHKLMHLAKQNNARMIFVGDRRQHLSVEAGDFLKVLEFYSNIKNFELSQIVRQIPKHYRKAVQLMANNRAAEGLQRLNDLGVIEEKSHHYLFAAARSYVDAVNSGKKCLLVSPTHREIDTLNTLVRREMGLDFGEQYSKTCFQDHNWTRNQIANSDTYRPGNAIRFNTALFGSQYQKHDTLIIDSVLSNGDLFFTNGDIISPEKIKIIASVGVVKSLDLAPGDKILITANNKDYDLTNGDTARIKYISLNGDILLDDGRIIPKDFESISYGYATTSHKSQGSTCDHAILAAAQMSNRACYVGSSRGRQSVKVFTPDFEHLLSNVRRNSEHLTGHDLIAARQEYLNDISPQKDIENISQAKEIQQETKMEYEQEFGMSM